MEEHYIHLITHVMKILEMVLTFGYGEKERKFLEMRILQYV